MRRSKGAEPFGPCSSQGLARRFHGCASGDHVVDDDHLSPEEVTHGHEDRPFAPLGQGAAGLWRTGDPVEQRPARQPDLAGHATGQ